MSLALQSFLRFPNGCQGTSPHQQGRGTKMTEHCYCGIDVAKERLDVQVLPHRQRFSVDNNATGWAELVERLHALPIAAVGIEPSGGYERGIIRILLAAGLSVRRINPSKLRQFARARGILAKNDRLDAQLIAEYVSIIPTRVVQRVATAERLAEVVTMRRSFATSMSRSRTRPLMLRMLYCGASTTVASRGLRPISICSTNAWPR